MNSTPANKFIVQKAGQWFLRFLRHSSVRRLDYTEHETTFVDDGSGSYSDCGDAFIFRHVKALKIIYISVCSLL